jgi:ribosomal protein S18 acetylase RimI-like enzyme
LFSEYSYKDYQLKVMGVDKTNMTKYLSKTLTQKGMQSICLHNENGLAGLISLQSLPWMSEHFGVRMYAVRHLLARSDGPLGHARLLRYVIEELPDVDFLDCRVAVDDVHSAHALESCGFRYVGTELYVARSLKDFPQPEPHPRFDIRPCRESEQERVLRIASETHVHNRFAYDPMIKKPASQSLYRRLVANCFDQESFEVLVAAGERGVEGFIISKLNPSFNRVVGDTYCSLDFIGVWPETRSRGLGVALNNWALHSMKEKGANYAAVRTLASNYPAIGAVYRSGFRVTSTSLHFHRWIQRPARTHAAVHLDGTQGGALPVVKTVSA